jgi:hypothetical protein
VTDPKKTLTFANRRRPDGARLRLILDQHNGAITELTVTVSKLQTVAERLTDTMQALTAKLRKN